MGFVIVTLNVSFWDGRRVFVTGHTGFKGAWLCLLLETLGAEVSGIGLAAREQGAYRSFLPWGRVESIIADMRDLDAVTEAVGHADPEVIVHMAAQALEPVSFADPVSTYSSNVMSTVHLLEAIAKAPSLKSIVVVTSDKVYENKELGRPFKEDDPLGGSGPYSGSKVCVEHVVKAFRQDRSQPLNGRIATARAGNVVGGGDDSQERLLPDVFRALAEGREVKLRNPRAVRPWQFVLNPLSGYLMLAARLHERPEDAPVALNFGPPVEEAVSVGELVERTLSAVGTGRWVEVGGSFPEAVQLRLDSSLAQRSLGWRPVVDIDTAIRWTAEWYRAAPDAKRDVSMRQIRDYLEMVSR